MGKNQIANKIKELETQISKLKEQAKETNIKEAIATIKLIKTEKIETTQIIDEIKVKLKKNNEKTNDYNITYRREGNKIICTFSNGIYTGIGIARCNPEDEFNYFDGCILAEHRARSDFYIKVAEGYANTIL